MGRRCCARCGPEWGKQAAIENGRSPCGMTHFRVCSLAPYGKRRLHLVVAGPLLHCPGPLNPHHAWAFSENVHKTPHLRISRHLTTSHDWHHGAKCLTAVLVALPWSLAAGCCGWMARGAFDQERMAQSRWFRVKTNGIISGTLYVRSCVRKRNGHHWVCLCGFCLGKTM